MSPKPQFAAHDSPTREDVILAHPEEEFLVEEISERQKNERSVARLRLLWAQRSLLFRISVCGLILSTLIAFVIPSRYTSQTRLMPPDKDSSSGLAAAAAALTGGGGSGGSNLGGMALGLLGLSSTSDIFVGILSSRTAEDALIQKFDLRKVYSDRRMEDARRDLAEHTGIGVDRKSQIITITVTDRSPQRAAAMGEAYVEELDRLVAELSTSSARRERIFLEGRLQSVTQDLETAEKNFSQFASKNTAIDVPAQGKAMVEAAATLQGQLIAAQSELEGLKQIYTDGNVRVRSVTARVAELRDQLNKLVGKNETGVGVPEQDGESAYPSIRKLPLLGVTYADLYRQNKVQEAVYETLTQEYELAKVQEAKEIPTVKVLDRANVPDKRSFPPRLLIILMGTALALSIGIGCVLGNSVWEATDRTDPRRMFAQEIFDTVGAQLPWVARNGAGTPASTKTTEEPAKDQGEGDK
jgi:capsule polysaccharide export protein KpsE/RkpR